MPEEFHVPEELHTPKEVYVSTPEFFDRPVGYGTTGKKASSGGKSRASQIRKMMMYLAAITATMGSMLALSGNGEATFDAAEYLKDHPDWYCAEEEISCHFGGNGEGYMFTTKDIDPDRYYRRMTYKATGPKVEGSLENFYADTGSYKADQWEVVFEKTSSGVQGVIKDPQTGQTATFTEHLMKLDGSTYVDDFNGMSTDDILVKYRNFDLIEDGNQIIDSITRLEFTGRTEGNLHIKGKSQRFTYNIAEKGINPVFYLYYKGQKYTGVIHYMHGKPGIFLFEPGLKGFGPFEASER